MIRFYDSVQWLGAAYEILSTNLVALAVTASAVGESP